MSQLLLGCLVARSQPCALGRLYACLPVCSRASKCKFSMQAREKSHKRESSSKRERQQSYQQASKQAIKSKHSFSWRRIEDANACGVMMSACINGSSHQAHGQVTSAL
eukprot:TRINITY_DN19159_c0_g1_i1.p1 TRINITY_DN19159_c0_g1~~TRINITY_DN19159_c0_g1_i1.p1  ORF type:complete len:108 (-),score=6.53 TRINITY_DN19159_c0_g1_i1:84-407(-)